MSEPRHTPPPIDPSVNTAELFRCTERIFAGLFTVERVVAADAERGLFVVRHDVLKRRAALRVHFQPDSAGRRWFERETELLAELDHPGIRQVYSAGYREEWAFRAVKWIEGESLEEAVARGPRAVPAVLQLARDLISALDYAHGHGVVLRRIVPTSLMLTSANRPTITDLRWANPLLDVAVPVYEPVFEAFLAPETRGGQPGEPASDLYTAAALLYYAATGDIPPTNPVEIQPPSERRPACPAALDRIIMRALQLEPERRYLTAEEMGDDLLSDLGEFEFHTLVGPSASITTDNRERWEKLLRRALGEDYELLNPLGEGAFGRVYRVRDLALEREVALKVLHPRLTVDRNVLERFRREAQLAAQVRHPHIVDVFDYGGRAGLLWYTMAYVRGENLAQLVGRQGALPVERVLRLLEQSLSALRHAHSRGLIHRDLKPENMLIELPGWDLQITDFGLAIAFEGPGASGASSRSGTPEYAAPEQLLGERVDERADLYSLSVVTLFALLGRSPFAADSVAAVLARQTAGRLPDLRLERPDLPEPVARVLLRGAATDPTARFSSVEEYDEALARARRGVRAGPFALVRRLLSGA